MAYNSADTDHTTLIGELEFRIDLVTKTGQSPVIDRSQAYRELEVAGNQLVMQVPISLLMREKTEYSVAANSAVVQNTLTAPIADSKSTIIPLPTDFLRFVSINMKGWVGQPAELTTVHDALYRTQMNPATRADIYDPVVALIPYSTSDQALECFPQDDQANPILSLYIVQEQDPEDFSEQLRDALLWLGASRMLSILQENNAAASARQEYDQLVNRLNAGVLNRE